MARTGFRGTTGFLRPSGGGGTAPTFTADTPPATGTVGTPYTYTFTASGSPTITFSVSSGSLPLGLSLDPATGILSGTPTSNAAYTFQIKAQNGVSPPAVTPAITITIAAAGMTPIQVVAASAASTTVTANVAATSTANLLACLVFAGGGGGPLSVTDSFGNAWTQQETPNAGVPATLFTTTVANPGSITTVTASSAATGLHGLIFFEIPNALNTSPFDVGVNAGAGSGTAVSSGTTGTPSFANDLAIGGAVFGSTTQDTSPHFTSGAGVNLYNGATAGFRLSGSYLALGSATAQAFLTTIANSYWGAVVALIKHA